MAYKNKLISYEDVCTIIKCEIVFEESIFSRLEEYARKHNCSIYELISKYILDSMDKEEFFDDWTQEL